MSAARLIGIRRSFGSTVALAGADLVVEAGEVHGVLGENGAGKSTLLAILGGLLRPDEGSVEVGGSEVLLSSPREAWAHGIGLVHQHFTLIPGLTVLENLALGRSPEIRGWRLPMDDVRSAADGMMRRTRLTVPLDARVEELGVGERQRIEILKALLRDPPVLALDEPTAVLAPTEVDALFALLRDLASEGRAVILVAHKIDEVLGVADRVTVLRDGRTCLTAPRGEVDSRALVSAMVGTDAEREHANRGATRSVDRGARLGARVASLDNVRVRSPSGRVALDGISLAVRRSEIVGVAGVEGNGQRELALLLSGRLRPEQGAVQLPSGIGFVPQDRIREGLIADFDLAENVALALHDDPAFQSGSLLRWSEIRSRADVLRERFAIRSAGVGARASTLSGGNQQRLVVARELGRARDLLVAENPTRGLDIRATAFVHDELVRLKRSEGAPGVVLISTDLDEILELADRVLVMTRGALLPVDEQERTRDGVGGMMLGGAGGPG